MIEENGEPVLKVSGEIYGCVFTKKEFENYHLKIKVKRGTKKWEPRTTLLRDAGGNLSFAEAGWCCLLACMDAGAGTAGYESAHGRLLEMQKITELPTEYAAYFN